MTGVVMASGERGWSWGVAWQLGYPLFESEPESGHTERLWLGYIKTISVFISSRYGLPGLR